MAGYLIRMFAFSLAVTLLLEGLVFAWLCRPLNWRKLQLLVLVNVLTNPAAVLVNWALGMFMAEKWSLLVQIPIEVIVVLVEAAVYLKFAGDERWGIRRPILLAVAANGMSWLTGVILQWVR